MADRDYLLKFSKELIAQGKLMEAGWVSFRAIAMPDITNALQLKHMRLAFFAGAQHLFGSMMTVLDPGAEPTDADLDRMSRINDELIQFVDDFKKEHGIKE